MSLVYFLAGFFTGALVGVGAVILYLKWKMQSQLNIMEQQMEAMMDPVEGMGEDLEIDVETESQD